MNVPNILTIIRLLLVPIFVVVFYSGIKNATAIAMLIFVAAGITDVLDGYLARKYDMVTKWGSILDPLADKLMSITVLISLTAKGILPMWVFFVMSTKEVLMIVGGIVLFGKGKYIPAQAYGKIATALFYASVITLEFIHRPSGLYLIYITAAVALFALYKYCENFLALNKKKSS